MPSELLYSVCWKGCFGGNPHGHFWRACLLKTSPHGQPDSCVTNLFEGPLRGWFLEELTWPTKLFYILCWRGPLCVLLFLRGNRYGQTHGRTIFWRGPPFCKGNPRGTTKSSPLRKGPFEEHPVAQRPEKCTLAKYLGLLGAL